MKLFTVLKVKIEEIFGIDLRSLALFRIFISLLIIFDLIYRSCDISAFYSDYGVLPRNLFISRYDSSYFSLYLLNGLPEFQIFLFFLTGFFAVLFLLGYFTRVTTIILWILVLSLHARNPLILTGGDTLLHLMLFWSIFLPIGAVYSIDSILRPFKNTLPVRFVSVGTAAFLLQLAFLYIFTAINKICPEWLNGDAIFYALNIEQYVTPFGLSLLKLKDLLKYLTYFVLGFEFVGPFLLFFPFFNGPVRTLAIFGFFCLQSGFGLSLTVGIFPFATTIVVLAFIPTWLWEKLSLEKFVLNPFKNMLDFVAFKFFKKFEELLKIQPMFKLETLTFDKSFIVEFLATFFLICVFLWNLSSVEKINFKIPEHIKKISFLLGIEQGWVMFGPKTIKEDFWYIYPATLKNGKQIDLFAYGEEVSFEKPKYLLSAMYRNHRWRTYIRNLWVENNLLYPSYAQYLCNIWNQTHSIEEKVKTIDFYYAREDISQEGQIKKPVVGLMYQYSCL